MTAWPVDDDDRDPVLDACLSEVLGGVTPPDLSSRILAAWQQRQTESVATSRATETAVGAIDVPSPNASSSNGPLKKSSPARGSEAVSARDRTAVIRDATISRTDGRPTPRDLKGQASSGPQRSLWNSRLPLVTLAATLLLGLGLGLAALNWYGPETESRDQFSGTSPLVNGSGQPDVTPEQEAFRSEQIAKNLIEVPLEEPGDSESTSGSDKAEPFVGPLPGRQFRRAPSAEPLDQVNLVSYVDQNLAQLWREQGIRPSSAASDSQWGERVFEYLLGRGPTPAELQTFLDDASPNKRLRLVERLHTESGYVIEYAAHWAGFWTATWLGPVGVTPGSSFASREGFELYLRRAIEVNASLSRLAMQMLAATGSGSPTDADFHGATNFLLRHHPGDVDGAAATSAVARLLLGKRLDCAQCHDHPSDPDLTQQRFWELNAFFRQLHVIPPADGRAARLADRDAAEEEVFFEEPSGYQRAVYPVLPDGVAIPPATSIVEVRRREHLANWVTQSADFPRATVNRVWAHFFGYGIVHPLDDMGPHNPPIDPELLDKLTEQFVAHDYSLRHLTRWIVLSDAFGLGSDFSDSNLADIPERGEVPLFSRFYYRPLPAGQAWDSLQQLAQLRGAPGGLLAPSIEMSGKLGRLLSPEPSNGEGLSPDDNGQESRIVLSESLLLQPGKNRTEGVLLQQILKSSLSTDAKVEHLFWAAVARKPTPREVELARKMVSESVDPATVLQDIWWTLLHSNEFLLQP